jgi:hypothetical protein
LVLSGSDRWLSISEMASAMGYPVRPCDIAASGGARSIFAATSPRPPCRTRSTSANALGNAMHVNSIGSVLMAILTLIPELGTIVPQQPPSTSSSATHLPSSFGALMLRAHKRHRVG